MVRRHEFTQQLLSLDYSKNTIEVQMASKTQGKQASKPTKGDPLAEPHPSPPSLLSESINNSAPTAPPNANPPVNYNYSIYEQEEKVIPGYNFQSLFRKKSHIKLSKKKNKEQTMKRSFTLKNQAVEKESKNIQKGHWTHEENKLYHYFLEIHNRHFILKHLRRTDKIFKSMANFMKSRQAEQCRSHHQKMQKKYHNFYQILIKLRMDFYNTLNPQELALQLQQKGYKIKQNNIIKEEELRNGDLNCKQPRQEKLDDLDSDQSIQVSQENGHMLSQNYENDLDFKKMHFQT